MNLPDLMSRYRIWDRPLTSTHSKRDYETDELAEDLNALFEKTIEIPRIKVGKRQTIETLINEEALLLAKYLRSERETWNPRITTCLAF